MPRPSTSDSPSETSEQNPGRIFKTVSGTVGKFYHDSGKPPLVKARPHVFSEAEFVRVYAIPKTKDGKMPEDIDPETYHAALLQRLLMIGAIVEAPGETPMPTPGFSPTNSKNHGILSAAENVLNGRKQSDQQKAADLKRLTDVQKN